MPEANGTGNGTVGGAGNEPADPVSAPAAAELPPDRPDPAFEIVAAEVVPRSSTPTLGVTVDADPMAEVLRESGRYLFFFADELEAVQ